MVVLCIKNWSEHFENNRTRELKSLGWVPIPNKQDGDGYTELLDHANGAAHFGAWIAIVEVASKCGERGTLLRDGGEPHDSRSLARVTRLKADVYDEAIPRLLQIQWLETKTLDDNQVTNEPKDGGQKSQQGAAIPQGSAEKRLTNGTEGNGREWNDNERKDRSGVVAVLLGEGFKADDPLILDPRCTPEQVAVAVANANNYAAGKLSDRRGYIAQAIRKGYKPSAKTRRTAEAQERKQAADARESRERDATKQVEDDAKCAAPVVMGLADDVFAGLVARVLDDNPNVRPFIKPERSNPWVQLKVYELLRKEKAHESACS